MENNTVVSNEELQTGQIIKTTALLYLKEALVSQQYESCRGLIDTARNLGVSQGDISAVIADYLNADNPAKSVPSRLRSYKKGG